MIQAQPRLSTPDSGSVCPTACPGCAHRDLSAAQSLEIKEQWLAKKLSAWRERLAPIKASAPEERTGYRDSVCLSARWMDGAWAVGLLTRIHESGAGQDTVIPIPACPVHSPRVNAALACLTEALPPAPDFPMSHYVQSGAQVSLVVKTRDMPALSWLTPERIERLENAAIEGLWLHRHPCAGRKVFAKNQWDLVWGKARSVDSGLLRPQGLVYGPTSFQQLIPALYAKALDAAEAFLEPGPGDLFFDLYCGTGAGLVRWCEASRHVIGVEVSGESLECARVNAPFATLYRGACRHRLPQLSDALARPHGKRLIFANPPRTGLEPELRQWITEVCGPDQMAYLSCSAGTLQRDLLELEARGYQAETIIPYDFFPQTHHVEALAMIRRTRTNSF